MVLLETGRFRKLKPKCLKFIVVPFLSLIGLCKEELWLEEPEKHRHLRRRWARWT